MSSFTALNSALLLTKRGAAFEVSFEMRSYGGVDNSQAVLEMYRENISAHCHPVLRALRASMTRSSSC